ncbi:MAG TPA: hypothetical protein VEU96_27250 [Bryobacteraceae bacterium]|nr:hypothetical protein [Bryobacteraceae bacterium]
MRSLLHKSLAAATFLLLACSANAQYRDRYRDDPYRTYGRGPLDRVRADLNRAASNMNYLSEAEMRRFNRVQARIAEFQAHWERGVFDRSDLDDIIVSLRGVVDRNRLRPRDRDTLMNDIGRLRALREGYDRGFRYR